MASSLLAVVCVLCPLLEAGAAAQPAAHWFEFMPAADGPYSRFAVLAHRRIDPGRTMTRQIFPTLSALVQVLDDPARVAASDTVFIATDANTINAMAATPATWRVFERLGLQPIAPRAWGGSVNIFVRETFTASPRPVAVHVYGPDSLVRSALDGVGIGNIASVTSHIEVGNLVGAFNADQDASVVIVIYDEEPSPIVTEFVQRAKGRVRMLPADRKEGISRQGQAVSMFVPYAAQDFYPQLRDDSRVIRPSTALVTTAQPVAKAPLPILLTNVRGNARAALERAMGLPLDIAIRDAYLLSLYEYGATRCGGADSPTPQQFKTVLLNTYFVDRSNPYTVLALLGHLAFEQRRHESSDRATLLFEQILRDDHRVDARDRNATVKWLIENSKAPHQRQLAISPKIRERFAGHVREDEKAELVVAVAASLKEASSTLEVQQRCQSLDRIRNDLAALASIAMPRACGTPHPQRGLWSGVEFEPFYYLAVVDAIRFESRCTAGVEK